MEKDLKDFLAEENKQRFIVGDSEAEKGSWWTGVKYRDTEIVYLNGEWGFHNGWEKPEEVGKDIFAKYGIE